MDNIQRIKQLFEIIAEERVYDRSIRKTQFDQECCAPEEGLEQAGEDMAVLGKLLYKLRHSKKYIRLLTELHENAEGLNDAQKRMVECRYREYMKNKNVSAKLSYEVESTMGKAYGSWLKAKQAADFGLYRDDMEKLIDLTRKVVEKRENRLGTYYDDMLNDYEYGVSIEKLDRFFGRIKERVVPLINKIKADGKSIRDDFLSRPCPIPQQEAFSKYLLKLEGLRESALVLMTAEHPFTDSYGPNDVRVTTHYYENCFISNIFTTLHEGGHALFMQYEPKELHENYADNLMSNGMHECISRFYENIIGRSEAFIHFIYPKLVEESPEVMKDVTERELYEAVNIAEPDLQRMEADELTYCLHILIRYECEKAFVNGTIGVDEIPAMWNRLYKELLGLDVPDDEKGCLQDVHWTFSFGYFPSYALGNAYGAQILRAMQKDFDVFGEVEKGNLSAVLDWLKENVFSCASLLDPDEWLTRITGQKLDVDIYLDYLEEKFTKLYELN